MITLDEQWFDSNADRAYPLIDQATRLDVTSTFTLPNDLLVDARISAPANLDATKFYISTLSAFGSGLIITLAVDGLSSVATITVPLDGFVDYSSYAVVGLPGYTQVGGVVTIGSGASAIAAAAAVYTFVVAATRLLPTVLFPASSTVSGLRVQDSFGVDTLLTGDITFVAGDNAEVSAAGDTITIGMDTGVLIEDPCGCTDTGGRKRSAIKSINGVVPDDGGNIELVPVGCVQIETDTAQLKLKDNCAQPCCGTPEVQLLVDSAKNLDRFLAAQATRSADLESALRIVQNYLVQ